MSRDRGRINAVLKVRRIQEQQAAAEMARAQMAVRAAESELHRLREQYIDARGLDAPSGEIPAILDARVMRNLHAESIARGRAAVAAAVETVRERRAELTERAKAVKGLERLDARLADLNLEEQRRDETKQLDELAVQAAQAGPTR